MRDLEPWEREFRKAVRSGSVLALACGALGSAVLAAAFLWPGSRWASVLAVAFACGALAWDSARTVLQNVRTMRGLRRSRLEDAAREALEE